MVRHNLTQPLLPVSRELDPAIMVLNARNNAYVRELRFMSKVKYFEAFDMESVYKVGWSEYDYFVYIKCQTRQANRFYYVRGQDGVERRFRRAEVEVERESNNPGTSFHLGRFVYDDLLYDLLMAYFNLEQEKHQLIHFEEQIAAGRPPIPNAYEGTDWGRIQEQVAAGRPPIIRFVEELVKRRDRYGMVEVRLLENLISRSWLRSEG
jgi:hypothetical protein